VKILDMPTTKELFTTEYYHVRHILTTVTALNNADGIDRIQTLYNAESAAERKILLDRIFNFKVPFLSDKVICHFRTYHSDLGTWVLADVTRESIPLILAKYFHHDWTEICNVTKKKEIRNLLRETLLQETAAAQSPKSIIEIPMPSMVNRGISEARVTRLYQSLMKKTVRVLLEYQVMDEVS
jgi:hypothetical protein